MATTLTRPDSAYKTHEDGADPTVRQRLEGVAELTGGTLGLAELKESCKREADNGVDPTTGAALELGLMLPVADYEYLKGYAKSLTVVRLTRRRRSA